MHLLYYYRARLYAAIMYTEKNNKTCEILYTLTNKEFLVEKYEIVIKINLLKRK